ncbi:uncharacterized protein V1513DRAFT_38763 [Lipomyces chichibuensis]|uniref:uncharacterized protein n=1 Tax=Lipomyces chichibuensis TaxID=1546026 RepID=UPI003342F809
MARKTSRCKTRWHCLTRSTKFRPIGPAKWDQVVDAYEDYCLENGRASRDVGAIHRKFNSLVNFPKPTGDPTCPPDIKRAKEISRMINESVEMADLCDTDIVDFTEKQDDEGADEQEERE